MCNCFINNTTYATVGLNFFSVDHIFHILCAESLVLCCYISAFSFFIKVVLLQPVSWSFASYFLHSFSKLPMIYALGCSAPYIVIIFLVFGCSSSSSIFVELMVPAPYLTMQAVLELIVEIIFPSFNFNFSIFLTSLMYSLFALSSLYALLHWPPKSQNTFIHLRQYSSSFYQAYLFFFH